MWGFFIGNRFISLPFLTRCELKEAALLKQPLLQNNYNYDRYNFFASSKNLAIQYQLTDALTSQE